MFVCVCACMNAYMHVCILDMAAVSFGDRSSHFTDIYKRPELTKDTYHLCTLKHYFIIGTTFPSNGARPLVSTRIFNNANLLFKYVIVCGNTFEYIKPFVPCLNSIIIGTLSNISLSCIMLAYIQYAK